MFNHLFTKIVHSVPYYILLEKKKIQGNKQKQAQIKL